MNYEYDIAISYKSEMEETASKINDYLIMDGWNVFFAPDRQQELLSQKINQMLYGVYKNMSLLKVLLISENYLDSEWTSLEKRVSLESTKEDRMRLLIVNYTDRLTLPGELKELLYVNGNERKEDEIASLISHRLHILTQKNKDMETTSNNEQRASGVTINNERGIIAGDHAYIHNIKF